MHSRQNRLSYAVKTLFMKLKLFALRLAMFRYLFAFKWTSAGFQNRPDLAQKQSWSDGFRQKVKMTAFITQGLNVLG